MGLLILLLLGVAAGAFIGWNMPQPEAAKNLQNQVLKLLGQVTGKTDGKDSGGPPQGPQ